MLRLLVFSVLQQAQLLLMFVLPPTQLLLLLLLLRSLGSFSTPLLLLLLQTDMSSFIRSASLLLLLHVLWQLDADFSVNRLQQSDMPLLLPLLLKLLLLPSLALLLLLSQDVVYSLLPLFKRKPVALLKACHGRAALLLLLLSVLVVRHCAHRQLS